jgi:transposase-like protein
MKKELNTLSREQKYGINILEDWAIKDAKECPMCECRLLYVYRETPNEDGFICGDCGYSFTQK